MDHPYRRKLLDYFADDYLVQIDRNNASSIKGAIDDIDEDGVSIVEVARNGKKGCIVFIVYADIRGVRQTDLNPDTGN